MAQRIVRAAVQSVEETPDGGVDVVMRVDTETDLFDFQVTAGPKTTHLEATRIRDDGKTELLYAETIKSPKR